MSDVKTSLTQLITICREVGLPFVELLRPGTDRPTILEITRSLDLDLPEELIEFYEFCDGVDANGHTLEEVEVYYGYSFVPLGQAIDEYRELQLELVTEGWDDISEAWFPLLRIDSEFYFVDCDRAKNSQPYIVEYSFESGPTIEYQSIQSMIDTFAAYYSEGAFTVEGGRVTSRNKQLMAQINRQYNPEVVQYNNLL